MAHYKRYGRARRGRRRPRYARRTTPRRELKTYHDEAAGFATTSSWLACNPTTTDCLVAPSQGVGADDRIGNVYHIHKLGIKGFITTAVQESQTSPQGDTAVRIVIGIMKHTDDAEVVPGNVMDVSGSEDFLAFRKLQTVENYKILSDQIIPLKGIGYNEGAANLFTYPFRTISFSYYKNFPGTGLRVKCSNTGGTAASISGASLFMICIHEGSTVALLTYQVRARFTG